MKKIWLILPVVVLVIIIIGYNSSYFSNEKNDLVIEEQIEEVDEKLENNELEAVIEKKQQPITPEVIVETTSQIIKMFRFSPPPMTEDNLKKHNRLLNELNKQPLVSLRHFQEILDSSTSDEDGKRTLIINFANKLNISKSEKAKFYSKYVEETKLSLSKKVLGDDSLSVLVAVDYLCENIKEADVAGYIEKMIAGKSYIERSNILDRFDIYYPKTTAKFRK